MLGWILAGLFFCCLMSVMTAFNRSPTTENQQALLGPHEARFSSHPSLLLGGCSFGIRATAGLVVEHRS